MENPYENKLKKTKELKSLWKKLQGLNYTLYDYPAEIVIPDLKSLEELKECRKVLRKTLGSWTDKISQVWYSSGEMITSYTSNSFPISIWFNCKVEEYPEGLLKEGCKIVKKVDVNETYRVECAV